MKIYRAKDYNDMSRKAANLISAQILLKPNCVLGLATGSTPLGTYRQLVERYNQGDLDFSEITTVNLDEYKGLTHDNSQSYYYFMNENLFSKVNINKSKVFLPDGTEPDSETACQKYNEILHAVGVIDLQLLGLGHNGHIGFNEPADFFTTETHCITLSERTIQANARFFATAEEVPRQAYTMGIKTIMSAEKVLVVISGEDKADIVKKAFFGPITPQVPASILQLHRNAVIIADEAALSKCE
ncbi:MAG: glucosamine-6-phosphate deaminase [Lachnospiraceae bacterium]|nr:glucosamine-6-phosphate deaminase [Lachnospiraceae bacterium]MCI9398883.1 glucosamine-6-phosphate deaminase [Lachnospiraceae bacterium]MCX4377166.1 glucosamine-6-phosphate deaminase [Lachnospiraceae bacterium]